ncbi:sensor histidine kinase [Jiella sp. M17.18]|uniref:sensor histidine kinase n=1 Tax=Jiella sp. M17.18 TaxID=3234247 RepID=UPI0034DE48DD
MRRKGSLIGLVAKRILAFALLSMFIQACVVFSHYWFDNAALGQMLIENETQIVAEAFHDRPAGARAGRPPHALVERYGLVSEPTGESLPMGYWMRVRGTDGRVLYTNCHEECTEHFMPVEVNPPDLWDRTIVEGKPLTLVGGRTISFDDGQTMVVDFASIGDPRRLIYVVMAREMFVHMVWPMGLMLILVIGATIVSIRHALKPVERTVRVADALDPRRPIRALPAAGLPSEISHLVASVNRALRRIDELIRSQKVFAASIAHEIRTPVSIVKLELAHIEGSRARKAEKDLDKLTHTLEQLTALARLDAAEGEAFKAEALGPLVEDTVEQLAPLVFASGRTIAFECSGDPRSDVSRTLLVTLVRNLVENAMKHTPKGTAITVRVEEPGRICVSDDGPGFVADPQAADVELASVKKSGSLGVGLKIAERIAAIHKGVLAVSSVPGEGTTVSLDLPAAA